MIRMRFSLACIFITILSSSYSQSVNFRAIADPREASLDQYVQVEFMLENAQGKSFVPPDFKGWTVLQGPSTSTQVSIVNGAQTSSISYGYTLSPKSVGEIMIGSASIVVNGKTLTTSPLKIKITKGNPTIVKQGDAKTISKKDLFVLARTVPEKAYVGQQVMVEYKLYTAINIENYTIAHTPDFKGFYIENIPKLAYDNREFINGREYVTKVIYAASIYPIQSGIFNFDAMHVRASVVTDEDQNNANPFFLLPNTMGVNLQSNAVSLHVNPLPQPAPEHFSGAVGKYSMSSSVDQPIAKVNDAISLTVYVEGNGDLNRIGKPYLIYDTSAFQQYEPKVTKENTDYKLDGFVGMREMIYPIVAIQPGSFQVRPAFDYFDTDSNRYITLAPKSYNLNIAGNALSGSSTLKESNSISAITVPSLIRNPSVGGFKISGTPIFYILLFLPFVFLLGFYVKKKRDLEYAGKNKSEIELQTTRNKYLKELEILKSSSDTKQGLADVHTMVVGYLSQKWIVPGHTLSKTEWDDLIIKNIEDSSLKPILQNLFKENEMAAYAGQVPQSKLNELIDGASRVIKTL